MLLRFVRGEGSGDVLGFPVDSYHLRWQAGDNVVRQPTCPASEGEYLTCSKRYTGQEGQNWAQKNQWCFMETSPPVLSCPLLTRSPREGSIRGEQGRLPRSHACSWLAAALNNQATQTHLRCCHEYPVGYWSEADLQYPKFTFSPFLLSKPTTRQCHSLKQGFHHASTLPKPNRTGTHSLQDQRNTAVHKSGPRAFPQSAVSDAVSNKDTIFRRGHLFSWSFLLGCSNEIPYKLAMYTSQLCWTGWGMHIKMLSGHLSRIYECTWRKTSVVLRHRKSL